jgi:3-oxoacyl-[acyl-carrier protein] reductase
MSSAGSSDPFSLEGHVAIVTGGGHGIGAAYCEGLASRGAAVVVADIDADAAEVVADKLVADGAKAAAVRTDVADADSVVHMAEMARSQFGFADILVNNAAIFATIPLSRGGYDEVPIPEWDLVMAVNVKGVWLASKAVIPLMRERNYGKIINISSGTALKGTSGRIHYVASKSAVLGLTRTLASEVGSDNICVNAVAPGSTLSEDNPTEEIIQRRMSAAKGRPLARVQLPADLVGAVLFFASPASDFITGQTLVVDGGSFMH